MNTATAAVLSSFALGVGGVSAFLALGPSRSETNVQAANDTVTRTTEDVDLQASVRALEQSVADLQQQIALAMTAPRTPAQIDNEAIAMAVAAYFEQADGSPLAASAEGAGKEALGSPADIMALLAEADQLGTTALWKKIIAEGLEEEVLAAFKAAAEASPNDPEVQYALAKAYLGMTQEAGNGPLAGKYATLADQALDQALEADPQHWESRFTKATALSFWPPVFGKQSAAINEFETLVAQQTGMAQEPHFAQTHLLLGNMYQQTGQMGKAIAAWQLGLESFPGNAELTAQIALAQATGGGH